MNRTVRDLVDAIQPDGEIPVDPEVVWQGSLRRARQLTLRRRAIVAVAAAAAVVAVILAPSLMPMPWSAGFTPASSGPSAPVLTTPAPTNPSTVDRIRPSWSVSVRPVSANGLVLFPAEVNADAQLVYVRQGQQMLATVEVYEPGLFDPSPILQQGRESTVDGRTVYLAWVPSPLDSGQTRPTLAWQHAPDAWAVARLLHDAAADQSEALLAEIASLIEIGAPEPVRLPFRVGFRPDGMVPAYVLQFDGDRPEVTVYYDHAGGGSHFTEPNRELNLPLLIRMNGPVPGKLQTNTIVGGEPAMRAGNEVTFQVGDVWVTIGSGLFADPLADEQVAQIFSGLELADWNDQSTWFDANTAA